MVKSNLRNLIVKINIKLNKSKQHLMRNYLNKYIIKQNIFCIIVSIQSFLTVLSLFSLKVK